jgi:hypothetical protein
MNMRCHGSELVALALFCFSPGLSTTAWSTQARFASPLVTINASGARISSIFWGLKPDPGLRSMRFLTASPAHGLSGGDGPCSELPIERVPRGQIKNLVLNGHTRFVLKRVQDTTCAGAYGEQETRFCTGSPPCTYEFCGHFGNEPHTGCMTLSPNPGACGGRCINSVTCTTGGPR